MTAHVMTSHAASRILVQMLLERGMQPADVERQVGVSPARIADPDEWIPMDSVLRLWQVAIDLTGDPALALRLREKSGLNHVHFVVSLVRSSSNLLEAAYHLARYIRLASDADSFDIVEAGDLVRIVYTNRFPEYRNRWIPEYHLCQVVEIPRPLVEGELNPLEVHFQHADPGYADVYHDVFQTSVLFLRPENLVVYRKRDFLRPLKTHDPNLEAALKGYAELSLNKKTRKGSLQGRLRDVIVDCLREGGIDIKNVAKRMNMDSSTLYRQLKREGVTFKDLLLETRQELAKTYLLQGMTCAQVTYLLGFSEPPAFQRAFKRWFGMNPGQYRKSLSM